MGEDMVRRSCLTYVLFALPIVLAAFGPLTAHAQTVLYSDNFNTAGSASNYNVFSTTTGASGAGAQTGLATFAYDYSALGIPSAPNSLGDASTIGLRVQSDNSTASDSSYLIGSVSVVTKGLVLPPAYTLKVSVWGNYIGGTTINDANGTNGTTGPTVGVAEKGTTFQSALTNGAAQEGGFLTDAIRDPTSSGGTYRVYVNGTNEGNTTSFPNGFYAAGDDSTAGQYNTADKGGYYATAFPAVSAPVVQSSAATTQTGLTQPGTFGFAWHTVTIMNDGTNTSWTIDNTLIATVPDSAYTAGGSQISLGDQDGNTGPSSGNGLTYNFNVFDDLVITTPVPEPSSLCLLGLSGMGLVIRCWRRKP
jgi:hypothetical protein